MSLFSARSRQRDAAEPVTQAAAPPGEWIAWRVTSGTGTVPAGCTGLSLVGSEVLLASSGTSMRVRAEGKLWWLHSRPLSLRLLLQPESPEVGVCLELTPWRADGLAFDQDALAARLATVDAETITAAQVEGLLRQMNTAWALLTLPPCAQVGEIDAARDALNAIIIHALGLKCEVMFRVDLAGDTASTVDSPDAEQALTKYLTNLPHNEAHAEARCFLELPQLRVEFSRSIVADPRLEPQLAAIRDRLRRLVNTRSGRRPQLANVTDGASGSVDEVRQRVQASQHAANALDNLWLTLHGAQREPGAALAARHLHDIESALNGLASALDRRFGAQGPRATVGGTPQPRPRPASVDLPPMCSAFSVLPGGARVTVRAEANADRMLDLHVVAKDASLRRSTKLALQSARAAEANLGPEFGVVLTLEIEEASDTAVLVQVAPLLAVVADRALRGLWSAPRTLMVGVGRGDWQNGTLTVLDSHDTHRASLAALAAAKDLGPIRLVWPPSINAEDEALRQQVREHHTDIDFWQVDRLSGLMEHDGENTGLRTATVHFPVVGDAQGSLVSVSVKLLPAEADQYSVEGSVPNGGRDRDSIIQLLAALRDCDNPTDLHWRTVVSFELRRPVVDKSYQLALVLADRIARGRDFRMPTGKRLIATGEVAFPDAMQDVYINAGTVSLPEDESIERKVAVFQREMKAGERVLLPGNWHGHVRKNLLLDARQDTRNSGVICVSKVFP